MSSENNVEAAIRACHTNASHLIRSARLLVDHGGLMSAAYHLALLAIEETGKASLLRINWLNLLLGQARPSIDRKLDDHFQKLFYAFFLSAAFDQRLSKEDVDNAKERGRRNKVEVKGPPDLRIPFGASEVPQLVER